MAKIDIIIPVYNSAIYLKKCLNSILNQDFKDYRIIVIDDKSIDSSLDILRLYKEKYPNVITLIESSRNRGVASARNLGLEVADGEYVTFLDSDDQLAPNVLKKVNSISNDYHPDIVSVDMKYNLCGIDAAFLGVKRLPRSDELINPFEVKKHIYEERPCVTTKFIKREVINSNFPIGLKWEDYAFTVPYLASVNSIYLCHDIGYLYTMNPFGTTVTDMFHLSHQILDIFTASDIINNSLGEELCNYYSEELRTVRTINCLQRVRDLCFVRDISYEDKRQLANNLVNLINLREGGNYQDQEWYQFQMLHSKFYRYRMEKVEALLDPNFEISSNEGEIKQKIKNVISRY